LVEKFPTVLEIFKLPHVVREDFFDSHCTVYTVSIYLSICPEMPNYVSYVYADNAD